MSPVLSRLLSLALADSPKPSRRPHHRREARRRLAPRRLDVEVLEERTVPSTVSVANASLSEIGDVSAFVAAGSGGLSGPKDLALGPDGNVYVASSGTSSVIRYNGATGQLIGAFVASGSGGLSTPFGLAFGPDGNLYVGSEGTNAIYKYSGSTGAFLSTFVSAGSGGLNVPKGLVFGQDGNLYVSSRDSNSILRYQGASGPAPGAALPAAGRSGATFVASGSGGLRTPVDLTFGPDGNLDVASGNLGVLKFDGTTGAFITTVAAAGTGGLADPRGLAFDQDGRLYVADDVTNAVHRFDSQGQYLDDAVGTASSLHGPVGIIFDPQGDLLVSGRDTNTVARYDRGVVVTLSAASPTAVSVSYATTDGTATAGADYTAQAGTVTFAPGQTARRVLLATRDDLLAEGDETFSVQLSNPTGGAAIGGGVATVTAVDDDSARQMAIADPTAVEGDQRAHDRGPFVNGTRPGGFQPITFGPGGLVYVGDGSNRVLRYDGVTGEFIDTFITSTSLNGTRDIRFQGGYLYVGSEYNDEVLRFDAATGAPAGVSGVPGDPVFVAAGSGGIDAPHGMAFGPDFNGDGAPELYVTGRNSNNVVRYDGVTGQPLGTFIAAGSGGLSVPEGLTFDPAGTYVFVTSSSRGRVLKYDAHTGAYISVGASTNLSWPKDVKFGPDGLMYVASGGNDRIERFTAAGAYVDDYVPAGSGGMDDTYGLAFGPDGNLYVTALGTDHILSFGSQSEAILTISISTPSSLPVPVTFATADATTTAGSDYTTTTGTVSFNPGTTSRTIRVPILDDAVIEPAETFTVNLSNPAGAVISDGQGVGTIQDSDSTKFFVVDDGGTDRTYRYGLPGNALGNSNLDGGDTQPRGAASNAAGTTVWVADANKTVYVYSPSGGLLGSWTAGGMQGNPQVEGIATNGTDIWLLDNGKDKVYKYAGAASRTSGSQNAASSFALNSGNSNGKGLVTDGTSLWVVNDGTTDKVFKYNLSGSLLGSWTIDSANATPTGLTINPSNVSDIWVVDSGTDRVYQYTAAASRTSGSQNATASFALAAGNTNPQDIADPPPPGLLRTPPAAPPVLGQLPPAPLRFVDSAGPAAAAGVPSLALRDAAFALLARESLPGTPALGFPAGGAAAPRQDSSAPAGPAAGQRPSDLVTLLSPWAGAGIRPERSDLLGGPLAEGTSPAAALATDGIAAWTADDAATVL